MLIIGPREVRHSINIPLPSRMPSAFTSNPRTLTGLRNKLAFAQFVKLGCNDGSSVVSDKMAVNRRVPQKSILGSVLVTLYSADIKMHIIKVL